jgi:hypothetical protein
MKNLRSNYLSLSIYHSRSANYLVTKARTVIVVVANDAALFVDHLVGLGEDCVLVSTRNDS